MISIALTALVVAAAGAVPQEADAEVVVYGGTAGGAMAAIAAAREGAQTLLLEPGRHIGGMLSGGLGHTDYGNRSVIGGMALEFYERVSRHYGVDLWRYRGPEPGVAEKILVDWLKEAGVEVRFESRLQKVRKEGTRIRELTLAGGARVRGTVFVDATYEGDLLALAGVRYRVGRESVSLHGETWAGRQEIFPNLYQFAAPVSPFTNGKDGEVVPLLHGKPLAPVGEGDGGVQAYCFRLCLTRKASNRLPFPKPEGYERSRYELLRRYLAKVGDRVGATHFMSLAPNLPNEKCDVNSIGPISLNLLDRSNWEYPEASHARRREIWDDHLRYTQGFMYFLANDPDVPERIRKELGEWGLCRDEFVDTAHWPHQLYVREARRMIGEYVLTEHDLLNGRVQYDSIGMGSYNIDIREVQRTWKWVSRFPNLVGEVVNEGYLSVPVKPYAIPYRSLTPRFDECENLIVPVCLSASHVAFSSVRMEPQYMILGQSGGTAAALAARSGQPVQQVDLAALRSRLTEARQTVWLR